MQLNIIKSLEARDTGTRLAPRYGLPKLGLYQEADIIPDRDITSFRSVRRMEVRIGTQYAVEGISASTSHAHEIDALMRGRVAEHIYGPVYAELRKHLYDLMDEGIGGPVLDRLNKMLKDFEDAFRGQPAHD